MRRMSEIISFPTRMRFTSLRRYSTDAGIGGVVAVLFSPEVRAHRAPPAPSRGAAGPKLVASRGRLTTGQR